ncbi:MAG: hypothetical protein K9N06_11075 [Candidatus Cloacimonetes bacterium]|nr:hypothetical protein [Candidatus Cloacimonadota bacterium]
MRSIKILICLVFLLTLIPVIISASVDNYDQLIQRESEPYLLHNAETVSFDGHIWSRQYGMKEYYISPSIKDIRSYMINVKADKAGTGGFELIKVHLNTKSIMTLAEYQVYVPASYPKASINVLLPKGHADELRETDIAMQTLNPQFSTQTLNTDRENRVVIYEEGFEEDLDPNLYEIDGFVQQPSIIYRNICWGIVDCESYEGDQSLWCCADLYDNGWYTQPLDPCTSYTNWIWTYFARIQTIDVTVAEELVFEWWTQYALDSQGWGDWLRVWVIDNNVTDWQMIGEYTGGSPWTDMQFELEGYSNFAYYFEFESDDQEFNPGIYLDKISIYNMVPNLTWGEDSMAEYPYEYAPSQPHNLRVYYEVFNDSNADVDEAFTTEILLSVDDDYTTTDDNYSLETVNMPNGLDAGEMITGELVQNLDLLVIPGGGGLPEGSYHVMFMVDNGEDVEEAFEDDNLWAPTGTFDFGVANLTPGANSSYAYPYTPNSTELQVVAAILNNGTEATSSSFDVNILLSIDNDLTTTGDNYDLGNLTFSNSIPAGGSFTQNLIIDLAETEVPVSDYWIFYIIDVYDNINESNEYDNVWLSSGQFTYLGAPYLEVEPLALDFSFNPGTLTVDVSSNTDWVVTENSDWISIDTTSGTGNGEVSVTVTANMIAQSRTANVIFSGADEIIFVSVSQEAGIAIIYGDIDGTGIVDAYDASLTLQYVVGLNTGIDPFPIIAADVDGSGEISAYDAGLIMQFVVNIIDHFPVEELSRK